jgi:hypothetical protein
MKIKASLGKADIFARTTSTPPTKAAARPPIGSSVENKLTVTIPPDQVAFLDQLSLDIRVKTGAKIRRTEIIRVLVAGLQGSGLHLTACGTEAERPSRAPSRSAKG